MPLGVLAVCVGTNVGRRLERHKEGPLWTDRQKESPGARKRRASAKGGLVAKAFARLRGRWRAPMKLDGAIGLGILPWLLMRSDS